MKIRRYKYTAKKINNLAKIDWTEPECYGELGKLSIKYHNYGTQLTQRCLQRALQPHARARRPSQTAAPKSAGCLTDWLPINFISSVRVQTCCGELVKNDSFIRFKHRETPEGICECETSR